MTAAFALAQSADALATPAAFGVSGTRSLLALGVVAALLAVAVWGLGRVAQSRRGRQPIAVESAVTLGDKRSLVIVAVEGRRLLVGLAPGGVSLVAELHPPFDDALDGSLGVDGRR